MNVSDIE